MSTSKRTLGDLIEVHTSRGTVAVTRQDLGHVIDSLASRVREAYVDYDVSLEDKDLSFDMALLERINPAYQDLTGEEK